MFISNLSAYRCLLFVLICLLTSNAIQANDIQAFAQNFKLLPQPQKIELGTGAGISATSISAIQLKGIAQKPVLRGLLQSLPLSTKTEKGVLLLAISQDASLPQSREGYILQIANGQVTVTARDEAGLFYGCQTLAQLLEDAQDQQIEIPAVTITDYPELPYRAVHLDLKHHLDATHAYYDMIDRLAAIKINAIIVEFEDKLRYRKASVVGASHAIPVEEFAAVSRYAKDRNIEISPLVQGLGHASFILKHESYKKLRDDPVSDWAFDPLNPETYQVQFSLYEDAIAATPYGKYLHIGGDEVGNLGMSELAKKSGKKPIELQMYWLTKVSEFARQHNRIPIFWDDMVFKLSGLYETTYDPAIPAEKVEQLWKENGPKLSQNIGLFPTSCVYMRWNYDTPDIAGNKKAIDWYKVHNLRVMAATAAQTMWPMLPREKSNFQSIKDFCRIASEKKMDGILCTAWDDTSPHLETFWRGFHYFALFSWKKGTTGVEEASALYRHRFYSPALSDASFEFQDELEQALVFWEKALIGKGHRNNYPEELHLIELPDPARTGAWTQKYGQKLSQASEEVIRYRVINQKIEQAKMQARRNEYNLELMQEMNELQIYPAKLLLLLADYDKANSLEEKKKARQPIQAYVESFEKLRKKFEEVFTKTRILQNPTDYILDANGHHHLANGTVTNDWMYVYELAFNHKINTWNQAK